MDRVTLTEGSMEIRHGVVVSVRNIERSHVHGSGGGFTIDGKGITTPISITTTHTHSTEIWLRYEGGREERLTFFFSIDVREGHRLSVLIGGGYVIAVKNFTTCAITELISCDAFEPAERISKARLVVCAFLFSFIGFGFLIERMGYHGVVSIPVGILSGCVVSRLVYLYRTNVDESEPKDNSRQIYLKWSQILRDSRSVF